MITTDDPDEALDVASLLAYLPLPAGRRVAVVTLGGGWGVLTADALAENGLQLAELPPDVLAADRRAAAAVLEPRQPHRPRGDGGRTACPSASSSSSPSCDAVDAVITLALIGSPSSGRPGQAAAAGRRRASGGDGVAAGARARGRRPVRRAQRARDGARCAHIAAVMERTGKPIVSVPLCPVQRSVFPGSAGTRPVLLPSPPAAVRALASAAWYATHGRVARSA